jgi:hypothetical protein
VVERRLALALGAESTVRTCYVSGAADLVLGRFDACCGEEKLCGWRRANLEVEAAVRADGDAGRDWCAGDVICCASVEFLKDVL